MELIITIIIGAIAGWLAGQIMKGSGYGFIINAILGIVGSFVGTWAFGQLNINLNLGSAILESILVGAAGAVIVLFIAGLFKK
ncbi:MAG TPA: GlsB/YeaQ/YmgE family stress response membrane protein [Saprospiraceae bacterium]|nr:GlsB/YeaQ/YmgE family stress response membrane protein [Saprospiraceae bacterium]